jgi:hypothetical protein
VLLLLFRQAGALHIAMQALLQLKAAVAAFVAMAFVVPFMAVVQYKQTQKNIYVV